tara:strand:+ start:191 stop:496 length:306 start_codon:yes stop_codon:yes gene_type:complete
MNLTDAEITRIVRQYERRLKHDRAKYQQVKDDPAFIKQNRERANKHYQLNKEKKLQAYQDDKEFQKARSLLGYWRKTNKDLSGIETKHPEKYKLLKERGLL